MPVRHCQTVLGSTAAIGGVGDDCNSEIRANPVHQALSDRCHQHTIL